MKTEELWVIVTPDNLIFEDIVYSHYEDAVLNIEPYHEVYKLSEFLTFNRT